MNTIEMIKQIIAEYSEHLEKTKEKISKLEIDCRYTNEIILYNKQELLRELLKQKYPNGYNIYSTQIMYGASEWSDFYVEVFDKNTNVEEIDKYFSAHGRQYAEEAGFDTNNFTIKSVIVREDWLFEWQLNELLEKFDSKNFRGV